MENGTQQITIKIYRRTHAKLKRAQAQIAGKRGRVMPLVQVMEELIEAGIKKMELD